MIVYSITYRCSLVISDVIEHKETFQLNIIAGIQTLLKDKYLYVLKIEHLIKYLNDKYDGHIYTEFLDYLKWTGKNDRLLKILKYLHSGKKSREAIANVFGISKRVLDDDLGTLKDGFEFMGTEMKIGELKREENTYTSPVHSVFLALNSAEIYAMTIGLKLLSKDTVFQNDLGRISDHVYLQLSDFASNMIMMKPEAEEIAFGDGKRVFFEFV